jgi:hypothetical protein
MCEGEPRGGTSAGGADIAYYRHWPEANAAKKKRAAPKHRPPEGGQP